MMELKHNMIKSNQFEHDMPVCEGASHDYLIKLDQQLKKNYDQYYKKSESKWRYLSSVDKVKNIVELCEHYPHSKILEIGAGDGSILNKMSIIGFGETLHALEISSSAVQTIRNREIRKLYKCEIFDGYNVPYKDKEMDLIILSHVIEHVEFPRKLLYEASRVAKYVFIEVPLEDCGEGPSNYVFDKVGHINFFSSKTIRLLVQTCKLEVLTQRVSIPSKDVFRYSLGPMGLRIHLLRKVALKVCPKIAMMKWTYHSSMICKSYVN